VARRHITIALLTTLLLGCMAGPAAALEPVAPAALDDNVPGQALSPTPVAMALDGTADPDDVFSIWLNVGEVLTLHLSRGATFTPGFAPNLYVYAPGTLDINSESPLVGAESVLLPKSIAVYASSSGYHYVNVHEPSVGQSGEASLAWTVTSPVYRFYNFTNNTHFFTPSLEEANSVIAKWWNVFRFEGVAYYTNPANNTQPLYRFYNRVSSSHFYTASLDEANTILARWPHIFTYDGPTYAVNPGPVASSRPVFRFYNVRNGSHFYTASEEERDIVIANWPTTYRFEGPAFWIGQ